MSIKCPYCEREFPGAQLNARHLSKCNPALHVAVPPCLCGHVSTSLTQMKRHRRGCAAWQSRDDTFVSKGRREATLQERYGVSRLVDIEGVAERKVQTCLARYGAESPLSHKSSVFDKVQKSLEGKRPILKGQDNPFAWESTKEKLRATNLERYGAENPQQVPEIRARTCQTNLERYGVEEPLSSPEIRVRIRATCEERYGGPGPSCSLEVQAKTQETNLAKYGVPWTCMDPEVRRKQLEAHFEKYGGVHFFASSVFRVWSRKLYGTDHPMQNKDFLLQFLENVRRPGPNSFELHVGVLESSLFYTGAGSFWRWLPLLNHYKNPDFVVPGPVAGHPLRNVTKVVECFGDYYHSKVFTGKEPFDHEQELITAFREIGIDCLVIWESEVKNDPESVKERLTEFLACPALLPVV